MTYSVKNLLAGVPRPKGWDVADAAADKWGKHNIEAFMRATVRPWDPDAKPMSNAEVIANFTAELTRDENQPRSPKTASDQAAGEREGAAAPSERPDQDHAPAGPAGGPEEDLQPFHPDAPIDGQEDADAPGKNAAMSARHNAGGKVIASAPIVNDAGGDPVDLWGRFDPPEMPLGLLPAIIEEFALVMGARMGADPAGLAVASLVACAATIPDRVEVKVKRHDDWTESPRIWAALVGSPSTKKSPILSAATKPLLRIDGQMFRDWQQRVAEYNAMSKDERMAEPAPRQKRLRIEDATVEGAQMVLEGSPDGVLCLQDELSGFFGAMDKYNGGKGSSADRAFWLRSFNGGEYALNRVGRGSALIPNLSVCLLGGIQPEPIRKVASDAHDDGLLQRLFPIILKPATMGTDEPSPDVALGYSDLIEALHRINPPSWMGVGVVKFSDGAQAIRRALEEKHLELQGTEAVSRKLASHIGKYDGLFARLCLIWHCIEHAKVDHLPETISEKIARNVSDFLHRFLLRHAFAFYAGTLGLSDDHDRLTAIAGYILAHRLDRITNRDVQRGNRTMRGLEEKDIRPLLEQLSALGWLDRIDGPRPTTPPHWVVNPVVHAKFADRARQEEVRRRAAREAIAGLIGRAER